MRASSDSPHPLSQAEILEEEFACLHSFPERYFEFDWSAPYHIGVFAHMVVRKLSLSSISWSENDCNLLKVTAPDGREAFELEGMIERWLPSRMQDTVSQLSMLLDRPEICALTALSDALSELLFLEELSPVIMEFDDGEFFRSHLFRNNRWLLETSFQPYITPRALSDKEGKTVDWTFQWWDFGDPKGFLHLLRDLLPEYYQFATKSYRFHDSMEARIARVMNEALKDQSLYESLRTRQSPSTLKRFNRVILDSCFCDYQFKGGVRTPVYEELRKQLIYRRIHRLSSNEQALEFPEVRDNGITLEKTDTVNHAAGTISTPLDECRRESQDPQPRTAICLSGGGIRSATYALGVLQALSQLKVLPHFHYLSSVSGGGYIAGWLTAWISRTDKGNVFDLLKLVSRPFSDPSIKPIRHLRQYSNYLTPKVGLLSGDTWAAFGIIARNLLLNWLVLIPVLLSLVSIPMLIFKIYQVCPTVHSPDRLVPYVLCGPDIHLALGLALIAAAVFYWHAHRPGVGVTARTGVLRLWNGEHFFFAGLAPLILGSFLLTLNWLEKGALFRASLIYLAGVTLVSHLFVWLAAALILRRRDPPTVLIYESLVVALAGAFGGALVKLLTHVAEAPHLPGFLVRRFQDFGFTISYALLATPGLLGIFLLASLLYVGLSTPISNDHDREWWGRAGGWVLLTGAVWVTVFFVVLILPQQLRHDVGSLTLAGTLAGLLTLFRGFSPNSKKDGDEEELVPWIPIKWKGLIALSTCLFIIFLAVLLSWVLTRVFMTDPGVSSNGPVDVIRDYSLSSLVLMVILFLATAIIAGFYVDINKYSLHSLYRNRLIRAYLGASNISRAANSFTGFDDEDNVPLCNLNSRSPFPVINAALNLVGGDDLAWQERKASSFTFTPLHCGNVQLGYRRSGEYGIDDRGDPISLGTALAISGAAANPNMGYHSSPTITFLLTLFNVRLGWWLGNPVVATPNRYLRFLRMRRSHSAPAYSHSSPAWSLAPLVAEAFGMTNADRDYINLSDGGHFENLGLYEMISRRCFYILVIDAGSDEKCSFEDLGNAIRKVRIDLGISINITTTKILPRSKGQVGKQIAAGEIFYSDVDPHCRNGYLFYVKPTIYDTSEPMDIYSYGKSSVSFPHEPTSKQWFTESQFESYRMLGYSTIKELTKGKSSQSINAFFQHLCNKA